MPITRIVVKNDGTVQVEGIGYVGGQCLKVLQQLIETLRKYGININIEQQQLKPEAYIETTQVQHEAVEQ